MIKLTHLIFFTGIAISVAMPSVYAESAPVYDADTMQQFENVGNDTQDYPPPPAPDQGFVPVQSQGAQPSNASNAAPYMSDEVNTRPASNNFSAPNRPDTSATGNTSQRLSRLEDQVNHMQTNGASARVDSLQVEVQSLRGQVEELTHQLQQVQLQQKTLSADLDKRLIQQAPVRSTDAGNANSSISQDKLADKNTLSNDNAANVASVNTKIRKNVSKKLTPLKLSTATETASQTVKTEPTKTSAVSPEQPNVAEEQQIYQTAYNLIKAKKYNDAVNTLQKMLQKYPTGQFAANAHYWLGELYGLLSKHDQALSEFNTIVKTYPDSPRVSDAQLKVGIIYASKMNWSEARNAFKKVINHYPGTASARLAADQLKQLKQAGH